MAKKAETKKDKTEKVPEVKKPITTHTTNVKKGAKVILPEGFKPLPRLGKDNVIISTHNIEEIQEANRIKAAKEKKK